MKALVHNQITVGTVLMLDGGFYRVLTINDKEVMMVELKVDRLNVIRISMRHFQYLLDAGDVETTDWEEVTTPAELLTDKEEEELTKRAEQMERMLEKLYPAWERIQSKEVKPEVQELQKELGRGKTATFKLIRRYLQSGRNKYALVDQRKGEKNRENPYKVGDGVRGHGSTKVANDERLAEIFAEGFSHFLKNKENGGSISSAYRYIVKKYYMESVFRDGQLFSTILPEDEVPSYRRFWNYCVKQGNDTASKMKLSSKERRNNERLLHGTAQSGCSAPGQIVEVDEVEIDMINVASDGSGKVVGRAVMYLAVDVYSCCIVGCWADYQNNSFVGLTNLLMTFLEDPEERLSRYGIKASRNILPTGFLPQELRTDQGAEYTSNDIRRINREIGLNIDLVAPATGSLKGLVEQAFHQFQEILRGAAEGTGVILKRYDSRHYETACTDIEDIRKIAYEFVVYFNQHLRPGYAQSREMIECGVPAIPAKIWQYGCENVSSPRWITPEFRKRVQFALLKEDREFKVSRRGIQYKGLYYENRDEWLMKRMRLVGKNVEKIEGVRYDPRSINSVYMMVDGDIREIPLNEIREEQRSFRDMTWKAYDELHKRKMDQQKQLRHSDLELMVGMQQQVADTIQAAKKMQELAGSGRKNRRKNIRESMKAEKEGLSLESTVSRRMGIISEDLRSKPVSRTEGLLEDGQQANQQVEEVYDRNKIDLDDDSVMRERFGI